MIGGLTHQLLHVPIQFHSNLVLVLSFAEETCVCSLSSLVVHCSISSTCINIVFSIIAPCLCSYSRFYFFSCSFLFISCPSFGCFSTYYSLSSATYKLSFSLFLCYVGYVLYFLLLLMSKLFAWRLNLLSLCSFVLPLLCQEFPLSLIIY